jgi:hypothetical protein
VDSPHSNRHKRRIVAKIESLFAQAEAIEQAVAVAQRRAEKVDQAVLARAFRGSSKSGLTLSNIRKKIYSSDSRFRLRPPLYDLEGCPDRVTVPAWNVVCSATRRLERRKEGSNARRTFGSARTCVLRVKQGSLSNSVRRTAPKVLTAGEMGEEALPPSAHTLVWAASPVLKPAQSLVWQETASD